MAVAICCTTEDDDRTGFGRETSWGEHEHRARPSPDTETGNGYGVAGNRSCGPAVAVNCHPEERTAAIKRDSRGATRRRQSSRQKMLCRLSPASGWKGFAIAYAGPCSRNIV